MILEQLISFFCSFLSKLEVIGLTTFLCRLRELEGSEGKEIAYGMYSRKTNNAY
jgi:hypothetical protein